MNTTRDSHGSSRSRREALRAGLAGWAAALGVASLRGLDAHGAAADEPDRNANARDAIYVFGRNLDEPTGAIYRVDPARETWEVALGGIDGPQGIRARLSPDRTRLAYAEAVSAGEAPMGSFLRPTSVWERPLAEGAAPRQITEIGGYPLWLPGGTSLLLVGRPSFARWETWRVDLDGSNAAKLPIPTTHQVHDVSGDGWLVTVSARGEGDGREGWLLGLMRPDGTGSRLLTEAGYSTAPAFSPDGRRIASCRRERIEDPITLDILDLADLSRRPAYRATEDHSVNDPAWSPDGRRLVVVVRSWVLNSQGRRTQGRDQGSPRLGILSIDEGRMQTLEPPAPLNLGKPCWG